MILIYYKNQMITEPVNLINPFTISCDIFHTDYYFHENESRTSHRMTKKNIQLKKNYVCETLTSMFQKLSLKNYK